MEIGKALGDKIRHYRLKQNLTQEQLAEAIDTSGTYIGRLERGEQNVQLLTLERIAAALDVSIYAFFTGDQFEQLKDYEAIWDCVLLLKNQSVADQQRAFRVLKEMFTP
ncbi:helix-turn-helix domain-containing protein [Paenibacillus tuaregi]|uniref:helix-turn-helix domain-containing protein n=1 Tax=Paenibacillus tuaregi TaxID=1816681 RepID=UPI0008380CB5|nr:helix-turn-helix transcriptional regulator [Paenibacillus tuaregi]